MKVNIDGKEFIVSKDTSTGNIYFDTTIKDVQLRYFFRPIKNGYEYIFYSGDNEKFINNKFKTSAILVYRNGFSVLKYFLSDGWKLFIENRPIVLGSRVEEHQKYLPTKRFFNKCHEAYPEFIKVEHSYRNEILKGKHVYNRWFYLIKQTSPDFDKSFVDNQDKIYAHHYLDKYRGMNLSSPKIITRQQDKEFTESIKRELNENV